MSASEKQRNCTFQNPASESGLGYEFDGESRTVDVHIRTLRQKLGSAGELVETVRGVGYKINMK